MRKELRATRLVVIGTRQKLTDAMNYIYFTHNMDIPRSDIASHQVEMHEVMLTLIFAAIVHDCQAVTVKFEWDSGGSNQYHVSHGECKNIYKSDALYSELTSGECVQLWSESNCLGHTMWQTTRNHEKRMKLSWWIIKDDTYWNNKVRSISTCVKLGSDFQHGGMFTQQTPSYGFGRERAFKINYIPRDACLSFGYFKERAASYEKDSGCVRAFDSSNCRYGRSIDLTYTEQYLHTKKRGDNDWDDAIQSISQCVDRSQISQYTHNV